MIFFIITVSTVCLAGLWVIISFIREHAARPAIITAPALCAFLGAAVAAYLFIPHLLTTITIGFWIIALLGFMIVVAPFGDRKNQYRPATERFDERDIMFARGRYVDGSDTYERYYEMRPENKKSDDFTRSLPNLGEKGGQTWDEMNPAIAGAIFSWIERVRDTAEGEINPEKTPLSPLAAQRRLVGMAKYLGAADAGTTIVGPEHYYSNVGRGSGEWGAEIDAERHKFAIVFTVEMNWRHLGSAPLQPVLADSGRQYLEAAKIAFALAEYIRCLGYDARAHVDGNYRLVLPTIAVEAGLGEIGRHSLLITPREGTRVRIAAVTTELELPQSEKIGFGLDDFCKICKKCATNCPSKSIPTGDKTALRGTEYYKIDEISCYRMWRAYGTDCGICVNSCPYSRPSGGIHSFVRFACKQNPLSRRLFHALDDLFYGKRPRSTWIPEWMQL
jgi:reductive dehalogenase